MLASLCVVFIRKKQFAFQGQTNVYSDVINRFEKARYFLILGICVLITLVFLGIEKYSYGNVSPEDLTGSLISAFVVAFIIQFLYKPKHN